MVILIVDDDPVSLMLAEHVLRSNGHEVVTASSADAAEALLADAEPTIDVIVCDYMMPGANGLDLLDRLQQRDGFSCPPFVLLTGVSEADQLDDERVAGVSAYLTKPVRSDDLVAVVTSALDGHSS